MANLEVLYRKANVFFISFSLTQISTFFSHHCPFITSPPTPGFLSLSYCSIFPRSQCSYSPLAYGWVDCADKLLHMWTFLSVSTFLVKTLQGRTALLRGGWGSQTFKLCSPSRVSHSNFVSWSGPPSLHTPVCCWVLTVPTVSGPLLEAVQSLSESGCCYILCLWLGLSWALWNSCSFESMWGRTELRKLVWVPGAV